MDAKKFYYAIKPAIPRAVQIFLRRKLVQARKSHFRGIWPIDPAAGTAPKGWPGWPDGRRFAVVLTHDVELARGHDRCRSLMHLEQQLGFRSSFNFVPERYAVSSTLRTEIRNNGFEVGVHGLLHDGKLYQSRHIFMARAAKINQYLQEWGAVGFRSPAMHHQLEWIAHLNIRYDASTFDTDPFEPQADGTGTIFPFWVSPSPRRPGYVELPYTLPQDFTLFILLQETTIEIWRRKVDWIADRGGMVLVNTHPDYMNFGPQRPGREEFPVALYMDLLKYIKARYDGQYWHALPREVADFVRHWARGATPEAFLPARDCPTRTANSHAEKGESGLWPGNTTRQ